MAKTKMPKHCSNVYTFDPGMVQRSWAEIVDQISAPAEHLLLLISMNFRPRGYVTYEEAAEYSRRAGYEWSERQLKTYLGELERAQCIHRSDKCSSHTRHLKTATIAVYENLYL
jgi:hypothetical protein